MDRRTSLGLLNANMYVFLLREVESRGVDAAPLLRRCGLTAEMISVVGAGIPSDKGLRLLRLLLERAQDPLMGLQAGTKGLMSDLDLAGIMLRASADVSSAVELFTQTMDTVGSTYSAQITPTRQGVAIRYVPPLGGATPRLLHDLFLSASYTLAREVVGPFAPSEVRSAQPPSGPEDAYQKVFGVPVLFDSAWTQLVVPVSVTERLVHSDSTLLRVLEPHLERQMAQLSHPADVGSQVRHVLVAELTDGPLSITQVADRLGIGARTLRRHLQAQGTSFQNILDETKHELALQLLRETPAASGAQIADWLGYAEPPAFYRAFRRWTGLSFTQYREQGPELRPVR